ncbi:hypothetical protein [Micromonospora sp. NPDC005174]|uniref:hypothetical protein n=1 Tax=Micromonospora sp. NPDC005174 TaxID=3157018 RepID=UPI0033B6417B
MTTRAFYGGGVTAAGSEALAAGEITPARENIISALAGGPSGNLSLVYFTAQRTEAINTVTAWAGAAAAAATPTLIRFGVYEIAADGAGTLVAATANDTTLFAATNTEYQKSLTATFNKVARRRYAVGLLVVSASSMPTHQGLVHSGNTVSAAFLSLPPRQSGRLIGLSDLPSSYTDISLTTCVWKIAVRMS